MFSDYIKKVLFLGTALQINLVVEKILKREGVREAYLCKYSKDFMERGLLYLPRSRGQSLERTVTELWYCNALHILFPQNDACMAKDEIDLQMPSESMLKRNKPQTNQPVQTASLIFFTHSTNEKLE